MAKKKQPHYGAMYLNMIASVLDFALNSLNVTITNSLKPFKDGIGILKNNLFSIDSLDTQTKAIITGYAAQKKSYRKALVNITYTISKAVYAYAKNVGDDLLLKEMRLLKKELNQMKAVDLRAFVQAAIETVTPLIGTLDDYNVTVAVMKTWQKALDSYGVVLQNPRTAIAHRKSLNIQKQSIIGESVHYLSDVLDPLSLTIGETEPDYLIEWRNNRRLIPVGVQHTKIDLVITDENGIPLPGVTAAVVGSKVTIISGIDGRCTLEKVPFGLQKLTLTLDTLTQTYGPYEIKKGGKQKLTLALLPKGFVVPAAKAKAPKKVKVTK